tara:strand:+ start:469 stop:876 length:408 start_codon:yes stop_codon:yes gene_type:complete
MAVNGVGKAIYNILSNDSSITDVVGTRIFPQKIEFNSTIPAITYFITSTTPTNTKNGVSSYDYTDVQITAFGSTYDQASNLSRLIRIALDYVSGTYASIQVDKIFFQDANDIYDDNFGEKGIHYVAMDFQFNIKR